MKPAIEPPTYPINASLSLWQIKYSYHRAWSYFWCWHRGWCLLIPPQELHSGGWPAVASDGVNISDVIQVWERVVCWSDSSSVWPQIRIFEEVILWFLVNTLTKILAHKRPLANKIERNLGKVSKIKNIKGRDFSLPRWPPPPPPLGREFIVDFLSMLFTI